MRHHSSPQLGPTCFALLSVLALLALACFPVLAQAESTPAESSTPKPCPTADGATTPRRQHASEPPATSSKTGGGARRRQTPSGAVARRRLKRSARKAIHLERQAPRHGRRRRHAAQGSPGNGANRGQEARHRAAARTGQPASARTSSDDGGSSPLVPILIAIAVLAAISIGVVMIRQRRQRRGARRARLSEGELDPMPKRAEAALGAGACLRAALAVAMLGAGALRLGRRRGPGRLLGRRPAGDADPRTVPAAASAGGVDSVRVPIVWGAVQPTKGGPIDWSGVDGARRRRRRRPDRGAAVPHRRPDLGGAAGRVPALQRKAPKTPAGQDRRRQRTAWTQLRQAGGRPLRARTAASGPTTRPCRKRPIRTWQIWNEPNFKYFVARPNPAEYGKLVKLSYAAIKGVDPGAKLILGGLFARPDEAQPATASRRRPTSPPISSNSCTKTTPGIKSKFSGVALHPYTAQLPAN